ncbi:protein FAR1-RELATED SEQUENCE 5-like [Aegilops tauschii subsp. strangulata]|uniref:protein FAR1-RELATED SEQUENCE 5-like n=1 Tax=Aegilops tauschii subsp. strangulata TaxID=200361 RepID=UPI001ABC6DAB|nr:protein FAR1-RELATED SEQUENCE 5-like [Aegilops tauschii subsp. strangulata]
MADEELTDIMVDMEFGELMKNWIEDWSDDENSDCEDRSENGNEWDDLNFISECHNAYDYYGESDAETGLNDESLDAPDSGESQSSVIMSEVTQDDGAKNVQDIASADDKRDMFMQIMEMTFTSHDAAYDFYNSYARDNGFSIRKNKVRQGKRDSKLLTEEGHSRRLGAETRCFCETHLTVKLDQKRGVWYVESFDDKHSHMLAGPDEVPFLWSHRKNKEYQKHEIISMGAAGIRIHDMMDCFISKHVWYGGVGFTRREIYNLCAKEKRKLVSKGDAATAICIMASRKQRDPSFFSEYKLDKEGHLNRMFWCDSQSHHDYEDFGDVLVFDSTYKMNRYGMPFIPFVGLNNHRKTTFFGCAIVSDETEETYVWLLQTFLRSMCQKMSKSVITDADAAMIKHVHGHV